MPNRRLHTFPAHARGGFFYRNDMWWWEARKVTVAELIATTHPYVKVLCRALYVCVRATVANREARNLPYLPAFTTLPIVRVGSYLCDNSNNTKCEKREKICKCSPFFSSFFLFFPSLPNVLPFCNGMPCKRRLILRTFRHVIGLQEVS